MKKIFFEIEGICPLMMDKFVDGIQPTTPAGWLKQAQKKVYRNEEGFLSIPGLAVKALIREMICDLSGKKSKQMSEKIRAFLFIEPEFLSLGKKDYDCIDKRMVTRGKKPSVTRVTSYRPLIKTWKTSGYIYIVNDEITFELTKEGLETGGFLKGILSYRPEFGRFKVNKFEVMNDE